MDKSGLIGKLLRVAAFGTGFFTILYCLLAAGLLRRWFTAPDRSEAPLDPVTFFRPLKSGEPGLARNLEVFLGAVGPGDQVLFGAHCPDERELCRDLARKFPNLDIRCPPLDRLDCLNPKIEKLLQLEPLATHDRWIVLDSDTEASPEFLRAFRAEWKESGADAFSAPYVFGRPGNLPSLLDAAGTELSLWPGVAILRAARRVDFLTGACMAVRATALRRLGGWKVFAEELADDHDLGRAISRSGGRVGISRCVTTLSPPRVNVPDWLLHQHRVFATFRRCNPSGSLGLALTFGLPFSFLSVLANPLSPACWILHFIVSLSRQAAANALHGRRRPASTVWLTGLVEPLFWAASFLPLPVWWAGKWIKSARSRPSRESR